MNTENNGRLEKLIIEIMQKLNKMEDKLDEKYEELKKEYQDLKQNLPSMIEYQIDAYLTKKFLKNSTLIHLIIGMAFGVIGMYFVIRTGIDFVVKLLRGG